MKVRTIPSCTNGERCVRQPAGVADWFDERAEKLEDDLILRGAPYRWHRKFFERDLAEIQNFLNLKKDDYFLDIGCGNGLFLRAYSSLVKAAVGVDLSLKMLARISLPQGCRNLFSAQGDARALPFKAKSFDAILCNWMFHYLSLEEIPQFLEEVRRVGKPKARIFLGEIPLARSLRGLEARAGRYVQKKLGVRGWDHYLSPVETTRFYPGWVENMAEKAGLRVVSKGTMRHVLPSLCLPAFGPLVPQRIQHICSKYDYKKSIPLIGNTCFFLLEKVDR